jgi:hypothetical protein
VGGGVGGGILINHSTVWDAGGTQRSLRTTKDQGDGLSEHHVGVDLGLI